MYALIYVDSDGTPHCLGTFAYKFAAEAKLKELDALNSDFWKRYVECTELRVERLHQHPLLSKVNKYHLICFVEINDIVTLPLSYGLSAGTTFDLSDLPLPKMADDERYNLVNTFVVDLKENN